MNSHAIPLLNVAFIIMDAQMHANPISMHILQLYVYYKYI